MSNTARIAMLAAIALPIAWASAPAMGHAEQWVSAAQLAHACSGHSPTDEHDCDGYIAGAMDTLTANPAQSGVCPPAHTRLGAMREALGRFAQQRPEAVKGSGVDLVQSMVKTNYPCPAH